MIAGEPLDNHRIVKSAKSEPYKFVTINSQQYYNIRRDAKMISGLRYMALGYFSMFWDVISYYSVDKPCFQKYNYIRLE